VEAQKAKFEAKGFGAVEVERFPPCMKKLLAMTQQGTNVPHAGRFALTTFLHKIGMSSDDILKFFGQSPDFDESKSRYQIEHITGKLSSTEYTPPSCATMKTYGVCFDPDEFCPRINHPVSYYSKVRRPAKK
jgi:DNA primase large subunit